CAPHKTRRTDAALEDLVLRLRRELADSDLGAQGAAPIRAALLEGGAAQVPSERTINRILGRRGALDGKARTRRPAPPRGWYLPDLAAGKAELDSIDIVEGLVIKGGPQVEALNCVSLHDGLVASWPRPAPVTTDLTLARRAPGRHGPGPGFPGGTLAAGRPAPLRPVRQRPDLPGHAPLARRVGPGRPPVPGPGRDAGVRPARGDGLPGHDRELQR